MASGRRESCFLQRTTCGQERRNPASDSQWAVRRAMPWFATGCAAGCEKQSGCTATSSRRAGGLF
jgi:hypothetical protein